MTYKSARNIEFSHTDQFNMVHFFSSALQSSKAVQLTKKHLKGHFL